MVQLNDPSKITLHNHNGQNGQTQSSVMQDIPRNDVILGRQGRNKKSDIYFRSVVAKWRDAYAALRYEGDASCNTKNSNKKKENMIDEIRNELITSQAGVRFLEMNEKTNVLEEIQEKERVNYSIKRCLQRMIRQKQRFTKQDKEQLPMSSSLLLPSSHTSTVQPLMPEWITLLHGGAVNVYNNDQNDISFSSKTNGGNRKAAFLKAIANMDIDLHCHTQNNNPITCCKTDEAAAMIKSQKELQDAQQSAQLLATLLPKLHHQAHWIHRMTAAECPSLNQSKHEQFSQNQQQEEKEAIDNDYAAMPPPLFLRTTSSTFSSISMLDLEKGAPLPPLLRNTSSTFSAFSFTMADPAASKEEDEEQSIPSPPSLVSCATSSSLSLNRKRKDFEPIPAQTLLPFHGQLNEKKIGSVGDEYGNFTSAMGDPLILGNKTQLPPRKKSKIMVLPSVGSSFEGAGLLSNPSVMTNTTTDASSTAVVTLDDKEVVEYNHQIQQNHQQQLKFPIALTEHLSELQKSVHALLTFNYQMKERLAVLEENDDSSLPSPPGK